jgi:hypothetical protein
MAEYTFYHSVRPQEEEDVSVVQWVHLKPRQSVGRGPECGGHLSGTWGYWLFV